MEVKHCSYFTPPDNTPPTINIDSQAQQLQLVLITQQQILRQRLGFKLVIVDPAKDFEYSTSKYEMGADGLSIGALDSSTGFATHTGAQLDIALDPNFLVGVEVQMQQTIIIIQLCNLYITQIYSSLTNNKCYK